MFYGLRVLAAIVIFVKCVLIILYLVSEGTWRDHCLQLRHFPARTDLITLCICLLVYK